jgi:hypothetical protein
MLKPLAYDRRTEVAERRGPASTVWPHETPGNVSETTAHATARAANQSRDAATVHCPPPSAVICQLPTAVQHCRGRGVLFDPPSARSCDAGLVRRVRAFVFPRLCTCFVSMPMPHQQYNANLQIHLQKAMLFSKNTTAF